MLLYRNLLKCFVAVFAFSCSDLTPLYLQDESAQHKISNIDILPISGRYGVYLKNELVETFGTNLNKEDSQKYLLKAIKTMNQGDKNPLNREADIAGIYDVNLLTKDGITLVPALPAPVEVITMFKAADRPLLLFACMLASKF